MPYVLYDYDAKELASTTVFRTAKRAGKDADDLSNVMVVAVEIDEYVPPVDDDDRDGNEEADEEDD